MIQTIFLKWRQVFILSATFLFIAQFSILSTGCKKKENLLGQDAYGGDLLISGGVDTFSLITYTESNDSVYTSNPRYGLLGILNDPEFGIVDVGFYTQVRLSGLNPNFGNPANITIDSFVLALEYAGSYGYNGNQTFEVFEVDQNMYLDSAYLTTEDLSIKTENWVYGSGVLNMNPNAITVVGSDTVTTQLRIPLNPAKAMQIIQDATNFPAEYSDNILFSSNYLKGINVKTNGVAPSQGTGMVGYFDLLDQDSKMIIYYKENGEVRPAFDLVFNSECADYNRFKINNSGKRIEAVIADTTLGQYEFYAQAGKNRAVVAFPTLKNLPNNVVIHTAQLYLPIQHLASSKFIYPPKINLIYEGGTTVFSGEYDPYTKGYIVDLKTYVQALNIEAITADKLFIAPGTSFISTTDRIVFNGPLTDKKNKPRLILSYTEF